MRFSVYLNNLTYEVTMSPLMLIKKAIFILWKLIQEILIYLSIFLERNFSKLHKIIWIVFVFLWYSLAFILRVTSYVWNQVTRPVMVFKRIFKIIYRNDEVLNEIFDDSIKLRPEDIEQNNEILNYVVLNRVADYMKIVDDDFHELFLDILYGGSFDKDLKVGQPNEYDVCLMIDLSRSIDPESIKIEPDENSAGYVKIKICQKEFQNNENFWYDLLDEDNYLNQKRFRDWIYSTLRRALTAFSAGCRPEGYVVKHHKNVYCINFRPKGPAFTLTIIRKSDWRKVDVDLVPCLVFRNQFLPGFRPRKAKNWIAVAKPLQNASIKNREILWRTGFHEDEKRILAEPIKPIIKLVKKLRDVRGWVHLKSYFIETLFMHELDCWMFRFLYCRLPRKAVFIYVLRQLQRKLEKGELVYYWHEGCNLLDNSLSLLEMSNELKEILNIIDMNHGYEDEYFLDIFYQTKNAYYDEDIDYALYILLAFVSLTLWCRFFNINLKEFITAKINTSINNDFDCIEYNCTTAVQ